MTSALSLRGHQGASRYQQPSALALLPAAPPLVMELFDNSIGRFDHLRAAVGFATVEAAVCGPVSHV